MESSATSDGALAKLLLRNDVCGDLLDAGLIRKMDRDWPLTLAEETVLARLRRPDGAVKVDSASESLLSPIAESWGTAILD